MTIKSYWSNALGLQINIDSRWYKPLFSVFSENANDIQPDKLTKRSDAVP